jgi:hypothetical protein
VFFNVSGASPYIPTGSERELPEKER